MSRIRPQKFVHVVYRTRRFDAMLRWYAAVFDARVQHQDPVLAFLTYDDEHHRFAFVNLAAVDPAGQQVDCYGSNDEANAFMSGPHFAENPIGVEYDPDEWLKRLRAGQDPAGLLLRTVHQPVSPLRGTAGRA